MEVPIGGGVKSLPLTKKNVFLVAIYNFLLLTTYRHIIRQSLSVGIFTGLSQYFYKNTTILVRKKNCQNPLPGI